MGKSISNKEAVIIFAIIIFVLITGCNFLNINSHIMLLCCAIIAGIFAILKGYSFDEVKSMAVEGIRAVAFAFIVNIFIGMLISSWIASGTFSYLISLSVHIVDSRFFLFETFLFCALFSSLVGSSWITVGTIGMIFFFLSKSAEVNQLMVIGAIIGGGRVGCMFCPISDSVTITMLLSGVKDVYDHVKSALQIVLPAFVTTAGIYLIIDLVTGSSRKSFPLNDVMAIMNFEFKNSIICLIPVIILLYMILRKKDSMICLISSIATACIISFFYQNKTLGQLSEILYNGYGNFIISDDPLVKTLFSRGGIISMTGVTFTMLIGMSLGGIINKLEIMKRIVHRISEGISSPRQLVMMTMISSMLCYGATGDSQPAKILVVSAFGEKYDKNGVPRTILSRCLEFTQFGEVFFPWTVGGMYYSSLFGFPGNQYIGFIFFFFVAIVMNIILVKRSPEYKSV